jgi:hypothetical protein
LAFVVAGAAAGDSTSRLLCSAPIFTDTSFQQSRREHRRWRKYCNTK